MADKHHTHSTYVAAVVTATAVTTVREIFREIGWAKLEAEELRKMLIPLTTKCWRQGKRVSVMGNLPKGERI